MNRQIVRLYVVILILFTGLVAFTSRWSVLEAEELQANNQNRRPLIEEQQIERGSITSRDGVLIAESKPTGGGPQRVFVREYPQGALFGNPVGYSFVEVGRTGIESSENDLLSGEQNEFATILDQLTDTQQKGADITLTLKVTERFGYPGGPKSYSQEVSSTVIVSVHDSPKEIGQMARQFLLDFSDSRIRDVSVIMRNFIPGCYGTKDETDQVAENRRRYVILEYSVGEAQTIVNFGGVCPYLAKKGDACTSVPVYWKSLDMDRNTTGAVTGKDWLASFYQADKGRWGLCDSSFEGRVAAGMRDFVR